LQLHLAVDVKSEFPIAMLVFSANENKNSIRSIQKVFEYKLVGKHG
jgi:hypothetical protein